MVNSSSEISAFPSAFNLTGSIMEYSGDFGWEDTLKKAYNYFFDTFWLADGCPKYYNNSLYPIDIHCSAQGIITCLELEKYNANSRPFADRIARWAIDNMQDAKGYFYYQKTKWFINRTPYIRWNQAWMFYSLAFYLNAKDRRNHKAD